MDFNEYPGPSGNQGNNQRPSSVLDDERLMGLLSWVLNFVAFLIAPLIILLINNNKSQMIDHHAKQSLNFTISVIIYSIAGIFVTIIGALVPFLLPLIFIFYAAIGIYSLVIIIKGAIAASRMEHFYPPLVIPFFK